MSHEIVVSTDLPVDAEQAAALIADPRTFLHVCRPVLGVRGGAGMLPDEWAVGQRLDLRLTVLGVPTVKHRIEIVEADPQRGFARTKEHDALLPVWNHTLSVEPATDGTCRYTDRVETGPGLRGRIAKAVGTPFFRHRQRRLRRLALQSKR